MCKIRITAKNHTNEVIYDELVSFETALNPVERPSYIEYIKDECVKLIFHYTGSTEEYEKNSYNNLNIEYGKISGRIRKISTLQNELLETDRYNVVQNLKQQQSFSMRFEENFKNGLDLVKLVFKELHNKNLF